MTGAMAGPVTTEIIMCPGFRRMKASRDARAGRFTAMVARMKPSRMEHAQPPCPLRREKGRATLSLRRRTARSMARILTFLATRAEPGRGMPRSTAMNRTGAITIADLERSIEIAIAKRDCIRMIEEMSGRRDGPGAAAPRAEAGGALDTTARGTDEAAAGKKKRRRRRGRGAWKVANLQETVTPA